MRTIDELYNDQSLGLASLVELNDLSNHYKKEKEIKNYFRTNLLIIEILNNNNKYNESIELCLQLFDYTPDVSFYSEYKTLLDYIVYIYITKQYYQRALQYCLEKKKYIDTSINDEVNRWYLELAYIHEAIGQKNEALMKLTSIIHNKPDNQTKALVLSNITKLYVDARSISEARIYLKKCLDAVNEINDVEGVKYCEYLQARIYRIEKQYKEAYKIFNNMFKKVEELNESNFNYLNEFISLLIEMKEFNQGQELSERFYHEVIKSIDLSDKLIFFKNCLKIDLEINIKKKKHNIIDSIQVLQFINNLEIEIANNKDFIISEIKEDELSLEIKHTENDFVNKLSSSITGLAFDNNCSLREFIFNYSKHLTSKIPMQELNILLFNKNTKTILSGMFSLSNQEIDSYTYKNNRLYEKSFKDEDIIDTIIEEILATSSISQIDLTKVNIPILDYQTKKTYYDLGYKYILGIPLFYNGNIYGVIIYQTVNNNILLANTLISLEIQTKLFEVSLLNYLLHSSSDLQEGVLNTATNQLEIGLFYNDLNNNLIYLSQDLKKLLKIKKNVITEEEYLKLVSKKDLEVYLLKKTAIKNKQSYKINYHLEFDDVYLFVYEQASLFSNENYNYYCGTINEVLINDAIINELSINKLQYKDSLNKKLETLKKSNFSALIYSFDYQIDPYLKEVEIQNHFEALKKVFNCCIYYYEGVFIVIKELITEKEFKKLTQQVKLEVEIKSYSLINYPTPLIRIDDLLELSKYVTNKGDDYVIFNNDLYALFISVQTIQSCVVKGMLDNTITFSKSEVINTLEEELYGYNFTPCINGIYSFDSTKVISKELKAKLDEYCLKLLINHDKVIYSISSYSLFLILNKKIDVTNIIFNIIDTNDSYINQIIKLNKKVRLIINEVCLSQLSYDNLVNNPVCILGLNCSVEFKMFEITKRVFTFN